jgi:hypothetical protein
VSDIFREVEEDVRRERFQKIWQTYGNFIIAAVVLLFAAVGGWQLWDRHETQLREKAAASFTATQRITNPQSAASAFADLAATAPKGYAKVARLAQANAMFAGGQRSEAVALYKQIAADDKGSIGSVARLRAAWALSENSSRSELAELLAPLDKPGNAWRENAREVLAYADYRALDLKSAQAKYDELAVDAEAPDALRSRAKAMSAFLKTGGAITYGSVPPPAPVSAPSATPAP